MFLTDLTPDYLREVYMPGIDLTDPDGNPFPEIMFTQAVEKAKAWLFRELQIFFEPTEIIEEKHDYYANEWRAFGYLKTHYYPVIEVTKLRAVFPSDNEIINIPLDWIVLFERPGQIHIVPTVGSLASIIIGRGGTLISIHTRLYDHIPGMFRLSYKTGFAAGDLPSDIGNLIAMKACMHVLHNAGDMIAGSAGVANYSISADGLSSSIGTTASATNAGYGARILQWRMEIKDSLKALKDYYQGFRMAVL